MPQNPSLFKLPPKVEGEVQYPTQEVPNALDTTLRGVMTGLGLEEQRPGDLAGALGAGSGLAISIYPGMIAKAKGLALLNRLKREGMMMSTGGTPIGKREVPEELMNALEFAQQRWPRLFGHVDDIRDVDATAPKGLAGQTLPGMGLPPEYKNLTSRLKLSANMLSGPQNQGEAHNVVGHELTHVADLLRNGKKDNDIYDFAQALPGGYYANSAEIRARLQGARTKAYARGLQRREVEPGTLSNESRSHYAIKLPGEVQKPLDSRISGLEPEPMPTIKKPVETNQEKLIRMLQERFDRKAAGMPPDPRVPRK